MFCPKCGTKNPDTGKFCRSCGTDLGNVSAALSGKLPAQFAGTDGGPGTSGRKDPTDLFAEAVKQILTGIGFLVVAIVLFTTGVAGGKVWWWAMLFPAFGCLGSGISSYVKSKRMESRLSGSVAGREEFSLNDVQTKADLPPAQTEYVAPESRYRTGDLVPPSVTEQTTRHLKTDSEGETMTLPKK